MLVLLVAGALSACGGRATHNYFVRKDVDFSYIKRVAVLPFENLSNDQSAGERLRRMFACELLASGLVDVAPLGETSVAFDKLRLTSPALLKGEDVKGLCKAAGVQAVVYGTVAHTEEVKVGTLSVPEVALTFNMLDESGTVIWSSNVVLSGGSFWSNYLGGRGESVTEVSLRAIRDAIRTLRH